MSDRDLAHHHKVLRQFLDISDDSLGRAKPLLTQRAARAREKLLKLSAAQFRELLTDVYDELQRRIDELRGEPQYLLPKQLFHPKRNQARQKLALLPQLRFKDLVSDISYEIERRGLDTETTDASKDRKPLVALNKLLPAPPLQQQQQQQQVHQQLQQQLQPQPQTITVPEMPINNQNSQAPPLPVGVSLKMVVPTKANLLWSLDEEEDDENHPKQLEAEKEKESDDPTTPSKNKLVAKQLPTRLPLEVALLREQLAKMTHEREVNISKIHELELRLQEFNPEDFRSLEAEHANLKLQHDDLNQRFQEIQQQHEEATTRLRDLEQLSQDLQSRHDQLESHNQLLQEQLRQAQQQVDDHQVKARDLETNAHSHGEQLTHHQARIAELESQVQTYRGQAQATASTEQLQRELEAAYSELSQTKAQLADARKTITLLESQLEQPQPQQQQRGLSPGGPQSLDTVRTNVAADLDIFLHKMATIENAHPGLTHLKQEVQFWKSKFEELTSHQLMTQYLGQLSEKSMAPLVLPTGHVSLQLVADCHALVELFFALTGRDHLEIDPLFETVAKVSVLALEIAGQAEQGLDHKLEMSNAVRELLAFVLTATRYFAVYPKLIPKVIVERAMLSVVFTVCDLVLMAKLRTGGSAGDRLVAPVTSKSTNNNAATAGSSSLEDFGAKPLKIGNPHEPRVITQTIPHPRKPLELKKPELPQMVNKPLPKAPLTPVTPISQTLYDATTNDQPVQPQLRDTSVDIPRDTSSRSLHSATSASEQFAPPLLRKSLLSLLKLNDLNLLQKLGLLLMFKRVVSGSNKDTNGDANEQLDLALIHLDQQLSLLVDQGQQKQNRKLIQIRNLDLMPARTMLIKDLDRANEMVARGLDFVGEDDGEVDDGDVVDPDLLDEEPLEHLTFDTDLPLLTAHTLPQNPHNQPLAAVEKPNGHHGVDGSSPDEDVSETVDKLLFSDAPKRHSVYLNDDEAEVPALSKQILNDDDDDDEDVDVPVTRKQVKIAEPVDAYSELDLEYDQQAPLKKEEEKKQVKKAPAPIVMSKVRERALAFERGHNENDEAKRLRQQQVREREALRQREALVKAQQALVDDSPQSPEQTTMAKRLLDPKVTVAKFQEEVKRVLLNGPATATPNGTLIVEKERAKLAQLEADRLDAERKEAERKQKQREIQERERQEAQQREAERREAEEHAERTAADRLITASPSEEAELVAVPAQAKLVTMVLPATLPILKKLGAMGVVGGPKKLVKIAPLSASEDESDDTDVDDAATENDEEDELLEEEDDEEDDDDDNELLEEEEDDDPEKKGVNAQARQRQEYRKLMAAATFNVEHFDIDDPDNSLTQVLLYLEHQTVQVISTIQLLLQAIKKPELTRGDLRQKLFAIADVINQMTEATNTLMNQTRNALLKQHGQWVVRLLEDCETRMKALCKPLADKLDLDYADKSFKQRLAGISFDIAKCTKELVKTVEEASLKEDIEYLNRRLKDE